MDRDYSLTLVSQPLEQGLRDMGFTVDHPSNDQRYLWYDTILWRVQRIADYYEDLLVYQAELSRAEAEATRLASIKPHTHDLLRQQLAAHKAVFSQTERLLLGRRTMIRYLDSYAHGIHGPP